MNKTTKQLQAAQMARRGTAHKDEKRDRLIRVRSRTYDDLVELGQSMLDDFDDIISRLIKEHKDRQDNGTGFQEIKETANQEEPNNIIIGSYMNQHGIEGAELFNGVKLGDRFRLDYTLDK